MIRARCGLGLLEGLAGLLGLDEGGDLLLVDGAVVLWLSVDREGVDQLVGHLQLSRARLAGLRQGRGSPAGGRGSRPTSAACAPPAASSPP